MQYTLDLIKAIEPYKDKKGYVGFDFGGAVPTGFDSFRGYYERLALGFSGNHGDVKTIADFYNLLLKYDGAILTGWKGGDYKMDRLTLIHIANPGNSSDTIITNVKIHELELFDEVYITLITEEESDA